MPVTLSIKDERTIRCPVPASRADTLTFTGACEQAAQDGYVLRQAATWNGGHQRDPYVVGVILTFVKPPNKEVT